MYDFQFITFVADTMGEALSGARGLFKQAFPEPDKIRVISMQIIPGAKPSKIVGQYLPEFTAVVMIDSAEEIIATGIPKIDRMPTMPMRPIRE